MLVVCMCVCVCVCVCVCLCAAYLGFSSCVNSTIGQNISMIPQLAFQWSCNACSDLMSTC